MYGCKLLNVRPAVVAICAALPCAALAQPEMELVFTDITATAGVGLPGTLNESLAWGDYDDDGDQDLYLTWRMRMADMTGSC